MGTLVSPPMNVTALSPREAHHRLSAVPEIYWGAGHLGIPCLCVCIHAQSLSVRLFVAPWTTVCQAPLSMGFSRQEYWSGLPFPPPRDLPDPGIKPESLMSNASQAARQAIRRVPKLQACTNTPKVPDAS